MKKLQSETQYQIMLEYIQHLVSGDDITQNELASKYEVSQSAIYRAINISCWTIATPVIRKYRKGWSHLTILKRAKPDLPIFVKLEDFSDDMVRMVIARTLYMASPNRDAYTDFLRQYNLIDFAKSIRGTKANKYAIQ